MIIVCGGIKGGSGKTTVATNLAVMRAAEGYDVLLVDADDQETATDFTIQRNLRTNDQAGYTSTKLTDDAVRTQVKRFSNKYSDIIIDTGGRDTRSQRSALVVADALLVPFLPRSFDVWTVEKVAQLVGEVRAVNERLKTYFFLNRADASGQDNADAVEILRDIEGIEFIDVVIGSRKAFGKAASLGLGVTEYKPQDAKACDEITSLYRYVFSF